MTEHEESTTSMQGLHHCNTAGNELCPVHLINIKRQSLAKCHIETNNSSKIMLFSSV